MDKNGYALFLNVYRNGWKFFQITLVIKMSIYVFYISHLNISVVRENNTSKPYRRLLISTIHRRCEIKNMW